MMIDVASFCISHSPRNPPNANPEHRPEVRSLCVSPSLCFYAAPWTKPSIPPPVFISAWTVLIRHGPPHPFPFAVCRLRLPSAPFTPHPRFPAVDLDLHQAPVALKSYVGGPHTSDLRPPLPFFFLVTRVHQIFIPFPSLPFSLSSLLIPKRPPTNPLFW